MNSRGHSIVLIGIMGAGKTEAGAALAKKTGLPRFDTDEMIAARFDAPITEIFSRFGEERFREAETEVLRELTSGSPAVIATGGGMPLRPENGRMLRQLGTIVNLEADEEILFRRLSQQSTRPLLKTPNPNGMLAELIRVRLPLYRAAEDIRIDTSRLTQEEVADAILRSITAV